MVLAFLALAPRVAAYVLRQVKSTLDCVLSYG